MRCPALLADLVYRATRPAACVASPLIPERIHPGRKARRAIVAAQALQLDRRFARALLESRCRSALVLRHISRLRGAALTSFLEARVTYDGAMTVAELMNAARPIIFAMPCYGAPQAGALAISHLIRGECPATRPDTFDIQQTVVVPFFGRLMRAASATALQALRSRALIVPAFAPPRQELGVEVIFSEPVDPERVVAEDEAQAIFTLTHLLFSRIEAQLRRAPEHWHGWEALLQASTPLGVHAQPEDPRFLQTLKARFHALPPAEQDIPELELLLE
jgi:hypothetical protein